MKNPVKEFFLFASGVNRKVLDRCPTEQTKYAGIGATIFLTGAMATGSGGYALYTVFRSQAAAVAFGLFWGIVIFNLDRVIVSGMRKQDNRWKDFAFAIPRLVLAVLLAVVISRPLELRLYQDEIQAEIVRENNAKLQYTAARVDSAFRVALARLQNDNTLRRQEIASAEERYQAAFAVAMGEWEGTSGSGKPGDGPIYRQKMTYARELEQQAGTVKAANLQRINANDAEIARLQQERNARVARENRANEQADGFLGRTEAFGRLKDDDNHPGVWWTSLFITLVFIALETAPVVVKLLSTFSPYRPYDQLLEEEEFQIITESENRRTYLARKLEEETTTRLAQHSDTIKAELEISTRKNQDRLNAELQANDSLMRQISEAQTEIATRMVEIWREQELDKLNRNSNAATP